MSSNSREHPGPFPRWLANFGWATLIFLIASQIFAIIKSPPDAAMGHLQKIMYVHVPAAWVAGLAFFVVFLYSVLYLWKGSLRYDLAAMAAAEIGTVLTALTIALGSIWGRPTWGVWWTWDPRLTTTAILLVIFAGYLALRAFTEDEERRARWSAVVGILGFINVPIVFMSVRWWRTIHQIQSTPTSVDSIYGLGLLINSVAFTFVFVFFVMARYQLALVERAVESYTEERALSAGGVHV